MDFTVRDATAGDRAGIRAVHAGAFGRDDEARLVDRLLDGDDAIVSVVAIANDRVIGHVLFSALDVVLDDGRPIAAASLAPLAVVPEHQRAGVGAALTRHGLDRLRGKEIVVAIVLGHPEYYPRFGFSAGLARQLRGPFSGPAWMAIELVPGALRNVAGIVRYPAAFGIEEPA